ncbi:PAS domain-containing methyl-accepting chemotaxis protein [Silanimonas sp.]|uniref:methyl-accepting chemotaxis protein n=1 Tax=Silanimonas sp. TaxID=1929290 RepID=UPI0022C45EB0|nr:PAS domain-containing methyl-accepting chemotaxis protein [Silanimonas sp.]MCZ8113705.1 methyl-accepting chemotaxis protein [Silanimonas sp.]
MGAVGTVCAAKVPVTREALKDRPVTGVEAEFRDGETIVSSTDPQGRITYVNGYFMEISGYAEAELLGQPHRIIRHPDMPAAAFADMWATLKKGRPWIGLVKNRCKNGDHYWVEANVAPIYAASGELEGYVSVRRKPSRARVDEAERLYREIREGRLARFEIENGVVHPPSPARALNPLWRLTLTFRLFLLSLFGIGLAAGLLWLQARGVGRGVLVGGLAAGAAFATYSAWWLARDVVGRLDRAKALFREIAAEKHDGHVDISRADEVGAVLLGLKSLQVRLEFSTQRLRREAAASARINQALDMAETNIMVADRRFDIVFANRAVLETFRRHEARIATAIPGFRVDGIVGSSIDRFHRDPSRQRAMLAGMKAPHHGRVVVAGLSFDLVVTPAFGYAGMLIGYVVEWKDRTLELEIEREVQEVVDAASRGELGRRIDVESKTGYVRQLGEGINRVLDVFEDITANLQGFMASLAQGDLRVRMEQRYAGAFGQMADDANRTVEELADIVGRIQQAVAVFRTVSSELAAGNADLQERTEQQAASLEETASSMEELTATVQQNAQNARTARTLSEGVGRIANEGGLVADDAVRAMGEVAEASAKIEDIITVIDGIAFQTNILALNAAVAAARAGEQGRGFAVVAAEVRALAQRSAASAKEIKALIGDSAEAVRAGSGKVREAGESIRSLVAEVEKMGQLVAEISAASEEQAQGIGTVNQTISQLDTATQQNAALVEEASASARALEEQSTQLAGAAGSFRLP